MSGKGFAQRLRHVIAKYESSLASAGDGILFGRSFRQDGTYRILYMICAVLQSSVLEMPLLVVGWGSKYVEGRHGHSK